MKHLEKIRILILILFLLLSSSALADEWPQDKKSSYIDRCTKTMANSGLEANSTRTYCTCVANGLEEEFKEEEREKMMMAQPNPQGNEYDKRFFTVLKPCMSHLTH